MARFLIGIVLLVVAFVPLGIGIHRLRGALVPSWSGAPARLAEAAIAIASIVGVTELLGLLAVYRLIPVTLAYAALGATMMWATTRIGPVDDEWAEAAPNRLGRTGNLLAAAGVALVAGPWTVRASLGFTAGMSGADTLWYHLPTAARLVQTGSLRDIPHFDAGNLTAWYPNAATFFHATGMLFLESDILSPIVNHAWVALALLAGWVLGRGSGIGAATMLGVAVVMSFPGFVGHQAGSAMNDVVTLALVLTALALLRTACADRLTTHLPVIALAGLVTGVALGTKWTAVPTTGAVTVGVLLLAERGHRLRSGATWLVASGLAGGLTYARNFVHVGNPMPPIEFSLGPVTLDRVDSDDTGYTTVADWLFRDGAFKSVFHPGLDLWFGPLWAVVVGLVAVGLAIGLVAGGSRMIRFVAAVGTVGLLGYLFSPQYLELFGQPAYFLSGLRYTVVAVCLGLVLWPLLPFLQRGRAIWIAPGVFAVIMAASATSGALWAGVDDWRFQDPVGDGDTLVGVVTSLVVGAIALAWVVRPDRLPAPHRARLVGGAVAVGLVVLAVAEPSYRDERFAEAPYWNPAVDLVDSRIALQGINTQYVMYGDDLSNHVQWVGRIEDHVFHEITECTDWVRAVNDGDYTHAILGPVGAEQPGPYQWMRADDGAVLVQDFEGTLAAAFEDRASVPIAFFRLDAPLDAANCAT